MPVVPNPAKPDLAALVAAAGKVNIPTPAAAPPVVTAVTSAPPVTAAPLAVEADLPIISIPKPAPPPVDDDTIVAAGGPPVATPPVEFRSGPNGLPVFAVELMDNPRRLIEAEDRLDAIERYKVVAGILSTVNNFTVQRV